MANLTPSIHNDYAFGMINIWMSNNIEIDTYLTEHPEYSSVKFRRVWQAMQNPNYVHVYFGENNTPRQIRTMH